MTQDRFSAQLRQHLVDSADERAAEGQLPAVIDAVARTSQRVPLVARLTWNPGRIGVFPSAAFRYGLIAVALALATVGGAVLGGGGGGASTVFEGTWTAIDPGDRSGMTLVVGPGQTPAVYFEDGYASGGACVIDAVKRFTARGTGQISDDRLVATFPDGGGCGSVTVRVPGMYVYDRRTDTLTDHDGLVWARALGGQPDPQAPLASHGPSEPSTPPRSPQVEEVAFSSTLYGISLRYPNDLRTRPATELWTGGHLGFDSPAADVIFHPQFPKDLYLVVASQPVDGLTEAEWRQEHLAWICPSGGAFGSWPVDGTDALAIECDDTSSVLIFTESRGYLIRLVPSSSEPDLVQTYTWEWLKLLLETVDLRPEDAIDPSPPTASPESSLAAGG